MEEGTVVLLFQKPCVVPKCHHQNLSCIAQQCLQRLPPFSEGRTGKLICSTCLDLFSTLTPIFPHSPFPSESQEATLPMGVVFWLPDGFDQWAILAKEVSSDSIEKSRYALLSSPWSSPLFSPPSFSPRIVPQEILLLPLTSHLWKQHLFLSFFPLCCGTGSLG